MRQSRLCWSSVEVVFLLLLAATPPMAGCRVDNDAFQKRVFHCDPASGDPLCGTDSDGNPMTCYAALRQISGFEYCAPKCGDVPMSLPEQNAVCVQGNAKLQACNPVDDTPEAPAPGPCGNPQLGCLRTNVTTDEGVCVTMHPCLENNDCADPVKSTCAATFLKELYTAAPAGTLHADHLWCLQEGCVDHNENCAPGESCLIQRLPKGSGAPDICVPNCDSHGRCPPNFFCYQKISGPATPAICIPGLLGFVCETDIDCLVGKCVSDNDPDAEHGLKLCTITCNRDEDCTAFDSQQGRFVCSTDHRCVTPEAYRGNNCRNDNDCNRDPGTVCVRPAPATPADQGTCLRPCGADGSCTARGGIGHTCLPIFVDDKGDPAAACFPGYFPYPCFDKSQCAVPELSCVGVDLTDPQKPQPGHCTLVCATDEECQNNRWSAGSSYCGAPSLPFCLPLADDGAECQAAKQCASKSCALKPGTTKMTCGGK